MKKTILYVLGGGVALLALVAGGVAFMASQEPETITVKRSTLISAGSIDVHPLLNDYNAFVEWNPWSKRDPNIVKTLSDPPTGVGATYEWSGNDEVGKGKMETLTVSDSKITQRLMFMEPMESEAEVAFDIVPQGADTEVSWTMTMPNNFMLKTMTVLGVVNMDSAMGPDFEEGLGSLKTMAEANAKTRIDAEKLAAAQAAAEAAAALAEQGGEEGLAAGGEVTIPE
ncbi:MAG: SRPBCC family protein [Myxococcota bacterium]